MPRLILVILLLTSFSAPMLIGQEHDHDHDPEHDHSHESPYQLNWEHERKYVVVGSVLMGTSFVLKSNYVGLTDFEIDQLDIRDINTFDRKSVFNLSADAKKMSDYFAFGSFAIPLFFLTERKCRYDMNHILVMWLEANYMTFSITEVAKHSVRRTRPFVYNDEVDRQEKYKINSRLSFFSGHAAQTAVNSFFAAKVFSDFFPDSKLKPVVWTTAIVLPAISAYGRVKAGRHFPTDVMVGYGVGATIGILIPELHKVSRTEDYQVHLTPTGSGIHLMVEF